MQPYDCFSGLATGSEGRACMSSIGTLPFGSRIRLFANNTTGKIDSFARFR